MRLEVHQPMTEPFKGKTPTRIVVTEKEITEGENRDLQLEKCSRLRLKMEIHPVSNSKYFHIVVQLLFLTKTPPPSVTDFGDENDTTTTDVVELLFLAESRRGAKHYNENSQGRGTESSAAQSSSPLGDGAFVELAVGGQFFVINVFAEHKTSDEDERVRQDQSLGLCHRVIIKVSKRYQEDGTAKGNSTPGKNKRKNTNVTASPSQWLRNAFPPLRRVVTDDGDAVVGRKLTVKPTEDTCTNNNDSQELNRPDPTTSIPVCLQSWSVKSISTHGTMLPGSRDEICDDLSDSDAIIVAQGMEDVRVCRGVMFEI